VPDRGGFHRRTCCHLAKLPFEYRLLALGPGSRGKRMLKGGLKGDVCRSPVALSNRLAWNHRKHGRPECLLGHAGLCCRTDIGQRKWWRHYAGHQSLVQDVAARQADASHSDDHLCLVDWWKLGRWAKTSVLRLAVEKGCCRLLGLSVAGGPPPERDARPPEHDRLRYRTSRTFCRSTLRVGQRGDLCEGYLDGRQSYGKKELAVSTRPPADAWPACSLPASQHVARAWRA